MIRFFLMVFIFAFSACKSNSSLENPALKSRPHYQVKVKFEDSALSSAGEWLGGTEENPKYYTANAEEIVTPVFGVDIVPVTRRSVAANGQLVYPHHGFEVRGDLKKEHFLSLVKKLAEFKFDRSSYKPPIIVADSNFLEKGALVKHSNNEDFGFFEFKLLDWHRKR